MNAKAILRATEHRPWPLPRLPWIMVQIWHDLLFAHWPIPPAIMRQHVPAELPLDLFDGQAWIGIVPFHMSDVRPRWVPPLPGLSRFPELNVRTYVILDNKPGIYFFSLDATNLPAVWSARAVYHLPYFQARMRVRVEGDAVAYASHRVHGNAELEGNYQPIAPVQIRQRGTLEFWLTERYCLYTVHRNRVYRCEIQHRPWPLQDASAQFHKNTMAAAAHITLPDERPLLHFSKRQEVLIWPLTRVT
jgi:uncharacterized protein YqjF (DUF2071 family)